MKALAWHGKGDIRCDTVPDPRIEAPRDAIIKVTACAICGSDLHLMEVLGPFLRTGDVLGHEAMGIVEEVGPEVTHVRPGDRVVVPFNISCGHCWMCSRGLFAQCETTQNRDQGKGASLFGYTALYGQVPGGQAELVRVPHADFGPVVVPADQAEVHDERFLYLSDILPTAWQGVVYADVPEGGTLAVLGAGPVGQLAVAAAHHQGIERVIVVDRVPERLARARARGAETIDLDAVDSVPDALRELTGGRGPDSVLEAVGMEAHGNPIAEKVIGLASRLPKQISRLAIEKMGIDRLDALYTAFDGVRRGGTVSISGVYGGAADPLPMMDLFDKGLTLRMGQCHVKQWTDDLVEVLREPDDVFGVDDLASHRVPLEQAPEMYDLFQRKADGCVKVVLKP